MFYLKIKITSSDSFDQGRKQSRVQFETILLINHIQEYINVESYIQ